ncbi:PAS domain-containing protein [bacterium]|nr:PAS domain-containing protein [bacterium]
MASSLDLSNALSAVEEMLDRRPDVVFCIKDRQGRYVAVNQTCARRCGHAHKRELIGKTARDVFPAVLAASYMAQDERVLKTGQSMFDQLELIPEEDGRPVWHLTDKLPLHDRQQRVIGVITMSSDLHYPSQASIHLENLAEAVELIHERYADPLQPRDLARKAGLSLTQLDRRMKSIFRITTKQFITKTRIDAAAEKVLNSGRTIAEIAIDCGFYDHSSFARQFKNFVGITPSEYRETYRPAS